jgi:hypothetical protein
MAVALRCVVQGRGLFGAMVRERLILAVGRLVVLVLLAVAGLLTVVSATVTSVLMPLLAAVPLVLALRRRSPTVGEQTVAQDVAALAGPATAPESAAPPDPLPLGPSSSAVQVHAVPSSYPAARRMVIGYGLRSGVGNIASQLLRRMDQVLLAPLAGVSQLGLYVVAVALAEIPAFALSAVRDVIYATSAAQDDPGLLARATRCVILLTIPTVVVGVAVTPLVLPLLFGEDFSDAVPLAQLALLAFSFEVVWLLLGTGLLAIGRPGLRSAIQVGGVVVSVVALLLLVPPLGALGAALAMIGTRVLLAVASQAAFTRFSGVPVRDCLVPQQQDVRAVWQLLTGLVRRRPRTRPDVS